MKTTLVILTTLSVWVCASSEHTLPNLLRHRRYISESTRFHNEYHRSDRNTKNSADIVPSTPSTPSCVPGTKWRNNCNNCWCLATGFAACTLLRCPNFTIINDGHGGRTVSLNSIQESGGKQSRVRRSYRSYIPLNLATNIRQKRSSNSTSTFEKPCKNGSTWMWKCNSCRCFNGHAACTRMRCRDD